MDGYDAFNRPILSRYCDFVSAQVPTIATRRVLLVSPPFACGVTRLVNAFLELGIRTTNPGFEPAHWLQTETGWRIGEHAAEHLKWHLPALHRNNTFEFPEPLEVVWEHRMDFARLPPCPTILFVRDPRDAIHSLFRRNYAEHMTFTDFLTRSAHWPDHFPDLFNLPPFETFALFTAFWRGMQPVAPVKIVRFEDLQASPLAVMREALDFIGIHRADAAVTAAIESSSFEHARRAMEDMERSTNKVFKTARKGEPGEWEHAYDSAARNCVPPLGHALIDELGYQPITASPNDRPAAARDIDALPTTARDIATRWLESIRSDRRVFGDEIVSTLRASNLKGDSLLLLGSVLEAIRYTCKLFPDTSTSSAHLALETFLMMNMRWIGQSAFRRAAVTCMCRLPSPTGTTVID